MQNWMLRSICVLLLLTGSMGLAQTSNPPVYPIGGIPSVTVYQSQQLKFIVQGPTPGLPLTFQLTPTPQGTFNFNQTTGLFTYSPSSQDHFEFRATFTASAGTSSVTTQTIMIRPSPQLPAEYDLIQYKRPLPDESTGNYINYSEVFDKTATPLFNGIASVKLRQIEISGRTVVLDSNLDTARLLERINSPNSNISKLTIYCETLIIRSSIRLPQTNLVIYAKEMIIQDPNGAPGTAFINTNPLRYSGPARSAGPNDTKGDDGLPGGTGGDITLHIGNYKSNTFEGVTTLILSGGRGQDAGQGLNGQKGTSYPTYSSVPAETLVGNNGNTTCRFQPQTLPAGTIYVEYTCAGSVYPLGGTKDCPKSGIAPKQPGKPGQGGAGGTLRTSYDLLSSAVNIGGGPGTRASPVADGPGGTPTNAIWAGSGGGVLKKCDATISYPANTPPDAPQGAAGEKSLIVEPSYSWLHPHALRMIIAWAKDAYRDGNLEDARRVFAEYLPILTTRAGDPNNGAAFAAAQLEVEQYLHRLDANLDYYGNPAGWVPLLSLENNMQLLDREVGAAIPLIYLSERIDKIATDEAKRQQTLTDVITKLQTEVKDAAADFGKVQVTVQQLSLDASAILQKSEQTQAEIGTLEATLLARAQANVFEAHKVPEWKMGLRILSTACSILPVFQPVLAAVGTGLDLISNIDTNQPLQTLQQGYDLSKKFNDEAFVKSQKQLDDLLKALNPSDSGSVANYVKNAAPAFNTLVQGIDNFRQAIQQKGAPQSEIDAEFAKLRAQDSVYNDLIAKITDLNGQKAANAQAMSKAIDQLVKDTDTINADLAAIQDFQRAYSESVGRIDHSTVVFMRDMERRQIDRLQKYLYYMAKSYEYRLVKPYTGNLGLDAVMQKLRDMLKAGGNTLSQADIASIIGVYQDALRGVVMAGIEELQKKPPERSIQLRFGLTNNQLATLNTTGSVSINLNDVISGLPYEENRRLANLGVLDVKDGGIVVNSPSTNLSTGNVRIVIEHFGKSTLTSGGQRYLFRFGSPGFEKPFSWGASYDLVDQSFSSETLSLAGLSLLDSFLTSNTTASAAVRQTLPQYVEPSAESLITITRVISPSTVPATITRLRLFAQVDFFRGDSARTSLDVLAPPVGQPYVAANRQDLNGRSDGVGTFKRLYTVGTAVTLNAEPTYAGQPFTKWVDQTGKTLSEASSLPLTMSTSMVVQPIYKSAVEAAPVGSRTFSIVDRSGFSVTTAGTGTATVSGYAKIQPDGGSAAPAGLAIFGFRTGGVLVSEAGVPDSPPITAGRIYAEVSSDGRVNTGLAIANPNNQAANINFTFTDSSGLVFRTGTTTIGANEQIANFLDGANGSPFNGGRGIQGTFSFTSNVPVSVIALRGFTNERGEFLMTTLPVIDLSAAPMSGTQFLPQFADGQGWTTQILLVNPTSSPLSGTVQLFSAGSPTTPGSLSAVTINGQLTSTIAYSVPQGSAQKFVTAGLGDSVVTGSVRIVPAGGGLVPTPLVIYSYKPGSVTVSEAGVPANTGTAFRMYAELSGIAGRPGNIQSGVAVANTSSNRVTATYELVDLSGNQIVPPANVEIPASGQITRFLGEIFPSLPAQFQGVLRISAASPIAVVGLRSRYNERGDFLITTTPPSTEVVASTFSPRFFPQVADGGGYTTQFVLFSGQAGARSSGTLQLFSQAGQSVNDLFP